MTREEAIQILADLTDNPFLHTWKEQCKALHMAIEALSAEPKKREWINRNHGGRIQYGWWGSHECNQQVIESLPSAEAVEGEWIFEPKDAIELMFTKPKCSECGFESADGGNFCSNCGAKMTKGGDDE